MKPLHLAASAIVFLALVCAAWGTDQYARSVERTYIHALGPRHPPILTSSSALQRAAFEQEDLLPVYGASEVLSQPSPYQPSQFFATYPTGFTTFEVARGGAAMLVIAQALGGLGSDLRGKKVVISYTAGQFTTRMMGADAYGGLFSRLHGYELVFNLQLSLETKQLIAKRMLQYPKTLDGDPMLQFTLENLADGSPSARALYYLSLPLGILQTWASELQDHYEAVTYIQKQKNLNPDVPHKPAALDWAALQEQAQREQIPHSNNNPFGFDNDLWSKNFSGFKPRPPGSGDSGYLKNLESSIEWADLEILLRILKEEGAQPLLLGRPLNAAYYDAIGISAEARQAFFDKIDGMAQRWGVPVVDFRERTHDKYFGVDPSPHMGREGWVYVDRILDAFYHGNLAQPLD